MLLYGLIVFRAKLVGGPELAKLLWAVYFALGVSAMVIAATDVLAPVYPPNFVAALFLLLCVLIAISGFVGFHARDIGQAIATVRWQGLIETILVGIQFYSILFFLPFAISSLVGDANENRLDLVNKIEVLGSYGLANTFAGLAAHLFGASLVFAGIRLAQPEGRGRSISRAILLILASLSYVVYILAYVGRDGVVYWLMTALAVFLVFRGHIVPRLRSKILVLGAAIGTLIMVPFIAITLARFVDSEYGSAWSILDYFGSQIQNFSDYSSIERPVTSGMATFPLFISAACSAVGFECESWESMKEFVFAQYLVQDKQPWLFGTYVSDFVGDFGYFGALGLVAALALLTHALCRTNGGRRPLTLARLLLIMFLFLVPYWGVFYFRFSIVNSFIVVNLAFICFVSVTQRLGTQSPRHGLRSSATSQSRSKGAGAHPIVTDRGAH
jgi:hypothetical protein